MRMKCHDSGLACVAGGPVKEDVAMFVISNEAFGGECTALDVAGKVTQGCVTAAGVLKLDVPGFCG
jgi:hypothetical protein